MPRIYDSASNPLDFCSNHMPLEQVAEQRYGNVAKTGQGPDGRGNCFGYDAEHPPYEDGVIYKCKSCRKQLTEEDN
jgi:hypothetical protein